MSEQPPGDLRTYPLPRYCYYCLPLYLLLPAVVALGAGADYPFSVPIWCYVLIGVCGLVVGLPILLSFARVIRDIGEASLGKFQPISNSQKLVVGTVLIFRLPADLKARHAWSARIYYGSLIVCAFVSAVVCAVSFIVPVLLRWGQF